MNAGVACDVTIGKEDLVLKSRVLKQLSLSEYVKFRQLTLLVKTWASHQGILGARNGYFNSYSLALLVHIPIQYTITR